jgi:hypothetical protein
LELRSSLTFDLSRCSRRSFSSMSLSRIARRSSRDRGSTLWNRGRVAGGSTCTTCCPMAEAGGAVECVREALPARGNEKKRVLLLGAALTEKGPAGVELIDSRTDRRFRARASYVCRFSLNQQTGRVRRENASPPEEK